MMFIEEIVKEIRSGLDIRMKSEIPQLIGRNRFIYDIQFWLSRGSSNTTEILTISGMPGIGKTSLAKYIFGLHRHEFERSSFVEDIEGRCMQQSGSRVIITTKDGSMTDKALLHIQYPPKHTKLALNGLHSTDSLKLFCWHAFGGYSPKEGYEEDAIRASKYCGGHPLALKVLGSFLLNEDADIWSHAFTMLESREFQSNNLHKVLKIGFDSLPSVCKELFKHIACFFIGKETEVTEAILKDSINHTSDGIKKLVERCLLTIGVGEELKMHQLLQDMGRDLVRQESPYKPWKRSRVWNHEESVKILQEDKGTKKIQGLFFDMKMLIKEPLCGSSSAIVHEFQDNGLSMNFGVDPSFSRLLEFSSSSSKNIKLSSNALKKMEKLELLQLNHVKLNGPFKNFPKGLRGLCMHGFQSEYILSDLPMEHLVALDMSFSNLKQPWRKPKLLGSLKYLKLSYSKLVTIGGFKELPALERLILTRCESLTHMCESICECGSLLVLNVSYCSKLRNLPIIIRKLKNVKVLTLDGCGAGVFDKERKRMKLLKALNKDGVCTKLQEFFSSVTRLVSNSQKSISLSLPSSLVTLSLTNNNMSSESFPVDFSSMSMLKNLFLDCNPIDSIPDCLKSLSRLEVLSLGRCSMLKSILCPSSAIKGLYVEDCGLLQKITLQQDISAPPLICCDNSVSLRDIDGILKMQDSSQVDNEIICSLRWTDMHYVEDYEAEIERKKIPVKIVSGCYIVATGYAEEEIVWLSHWMFGNNELEAGDEVSVTILDKVEEDGSAMKFILCAWIQGSLYEREPPAIQKTKTEKSSRSNEGRRWEIADLDHPQIINVQNYRGVTHFLATWNVGGKSPSSKMNLNDWLHAAPPADIYVLGFQEIVPLNAANILGAEDNGPAKKWLSLIHRTLNNRSNTSGGNYTPSPVIDPLNMMLISRPSDYSANYRPSDYSGGYRPSDYSASHRPSNYSCGQRPSDYSRWGSSDDDYGTMEDSFSPTSNCGTNNMEDGCRTNGIGICEYVVASNKFLFCVYSFDFRAERRNSDYMEIVKKTRFPRVQAVKDDKSPQTILEHDRIIWLGDLNYRIALSYRSAKALVEMQNWRALLEKDQLRIEQRRGRVFQGWNEGKIYFPPTYKYLTNSDRYTGDNLHHKEKRRTPAWCDRILWYGRGLHQLSYVRGESRFSDHRPVYSLFWAEVELVHSRFRRTMSCSSSRIEVEELLPYANGYTELCFF
uniref:Toll/interleukin-1 receptor (TIR) domain-containing protein n=1 Tax=Tanacetum cinerariifolium TaxID=118510 RepID=A0A6L2N766_TANCI|nr:Toll/interleukin-1 receptor (TIR) domain-containing protein [Tanacetum cinerariifolium]